MTPKGPALPGNRWDLVDLVDLPVADAPCAEPARVSVVVTHYDQPRELARTLRALSRQTHPAHLLEVVVADDGSPTPPSVPTDVRLVTQPHDGFGAARARNRGAGVARGEVLVFLDADTTPEPGFVAAITRLPSRVPEAVVVGRRRHAALTAAECQGDTGELPEVGVRHELPEPAWLRDAYVRTRDLRDADETSFRFVISAVLACSSWLFRETGGFDETFTRYGGEDWEWAHRAWTHGALLAHEPAAVAWHDGPDHGGRGDAGGPDARRRRRDETLAVAQRIPVAGVAPSGFFSAGLADPLVTVDPGLGDDALVIALDHLLAALPRSLVLVTPAQAVGLPTDPRVVQHADDHLVHLGARSAWRHLHVVRPVAGPVAAWVATGSCLAGPGAPGRVDVTTADGVTALRWTTLRAERRAARWSDPTLDRAVTTVARDLRSVPAAVTVQAHWGGWA